MLPEKPQNAPSHQQEVSGGLGVACCNDWRAGERQAIGMV